MAITYSEAPDIKELAEKIVARLKKFSHVDLNHLYYFRSKGSKSRRTVARIYGLNKIWQQALGTNCSYVIEVISERYDGLDQTEKEKILIHELLHIPKGFSGGFRPHKGFINQHTINALHKIFKNQQETTMAIIMKSKSP